MPSYAAIAPIAQHRGREPQLACDLDQRPTTARQQGNRLPLELIRKMTPFLAHSTPFRSRRSLAKVSTNAGEAQTYRTAAALLGQMFPVDAGQDPETLRRHTFKIAQTVSMTSAGLPRDWGSGCGGHWRGRVIGGVETLPEAGAERAVVDGAADLEQQIGPTPGP